MQTRPDMSGFYWLASYPKSGNTWLRLFLESLAASGASPDINSLQLAHGNAADRDAFDRILDLESSDLTDAEIARLRPRQYELEARQADAPLLRKVHDAWQRTPADEALFPVEPTLGAIYLVRDPRDVAVSLAYHMNQSIDQAINCMADPSGALARAKRHIPNQLPQRLFSWSGHVQSWLDAPVNRLVLKYEDLISSPCERFGAAAHFLGLEAQPETVSAAVAAVSFGRLRAAEDAHGFAERQPGQERFFRRGIAGGWQDSLTSAQAARIEADHGEMMRKLGYL
jgi:hypothetical protein